MMEGGLNATRGSDNDDSDAPLLPPRPSRPDGRAGSGAGSGAGARGNGTARNPTVTMKGTRPIGGAGGRNVLMSPFRTSPKNVVQLAMMKPHNTAFCSCSSWRLWMLLLSLFALFFFIVTDVLGFAFRNDECPVDLAGWLLVGGIAIPAGYGLMLGKTFISSLLAANDENHSHCLVRTLDIGAFVTCLALVVFSIVWVFWGAASVVDIYDVAEGGGQKCAPRLLLTAEIVATFGMVTCALLVLMSLAAVLMLANGIWFFSLPTFTPKQDLASNAAATATDLTSPRSTDDHEDGYNSDSDHLIGHYPPGVDVHNFKPQGRAAERTA